MDYYPLKPEKNQSQITVGGDKLSCLYDAGSSTIDLLESNLLINNTISDARKGTWFCSADI